MKGGAVTREKVVGRPKLRYSTQSWFCPGCTYGTMHRLICEVIEELGIEGKTIGIVSAGCYVMTPWFIDIDWVTALHGRAPAVATAVKRVHPDKIVFSLQGDGDLGAIGAGEFLNVLLRGENLTNIFLNNAGYGQTGGQMAPTTLLGMKTTTTPYGRDARKAGFPLHAAELAASMRGVAYSVRCALNNPANVQRAKRAIRKAFQNQIEGVGYSFVELLSACPGNWAMQPIECLRFLEEKMMVEYPLGEFKNVPSIDYGPTSSGGTG